MKKPEDLISVYKTNEVVADVYTIVFKENHIMGMSKNPFSPLGFNQYCGQFIYKPDSTDKKIKWANLPLEIQKAIINRCE